MLYHVSTILSILVHYVSKTHAQGAKVAALALRRIAIDKASGIKNDHNDWCKEHNNPRYIVDLLKRGIQVSLETMKIVNALPALNERKQ